MRSGKMVYRNKKIKFIKPKLDKLQWTGKREWYSAENIEGLCIQVNKSSTTSVLLIYS